MEITIKDLENDLKSLPKELLQQVSDYVTFLKMKYTGQVNEDWANYLSESQKESIDKGLEDIENGKSIPTQKLRKESKIIFQKNRNNGNYL
ncbi:MAG: hypothetical protein E2590_12620 [Chryseobacterium sp.]|nr:hypothetical protein [Chryseobacterium sp.]